MISERKLSKSELDKREDIIMNMKDNKRDLVKKYGKDAETVMYGRATNMAKKQTKEMRDPKLTELIKDALKNPKKADLNKDGKLSDYEENRGAAVEKNLKETLDDDVWMKVDALKNNLRGEELIDVITKAMSTDDAHLYFDAIMRDYDISLEDAREDYYKLEEISKQAAELVDGYELSDLESNLEQIYRDMEQEAEPEGGPIADQYADEIHKHEEAIRFIKDKGQEKAQMTYDQAIGRDKVTADRDAFERSSKFNRMEEDLDLGHEDNEPNMIKAELYHIGKCAMKLYGILDKFDDGGEVDLPAWWQSKISKSKEALVGAEQYLDFELNEPKIDAVVDVATDVVNDVDIEVVDSVDIDETVEDYITSVDDLNEKTINAQGIEAAYVKGFNNVAAKNVAEKLSKKLKEGLPKGFWDKKIDAEDENQDGKIDEVELPTSTIQKLANEITDPQTFAKAMLGIYNAIQDKEQKDYSKNQKFGRVLSFLNDIADDEIEKEIDESYNTLVNKIEKQGKSEKAAKAIAGAVASYKAKGGGKGPTAKQK